MNRKTYVFDTNVLLYDPSAMFQFEDNVVVIPITVIEEIDRFKKDLNEIGRNARQVSRHLDGLRAERDLARGVDLPGGGLLRVDLTHQELPEPLGRVSSSSRADNLILGAALYLHQRGGEGGPVIVVTKDTNMRIKADALGLRAEDYEHGKVAEIAELYTGQAERIVPREVIEQLYREGEADVIGEPLHANQYVVLRNEGNANHTALARAVPGSSRVRQLKRVKEGVWGVFPRNKEQSFALDLLLDDDIKMATLVGMAGTGKTLLAIAAGLHRSGDGAGFHRLLVSRPIFPLGRDIGFLPGDIDEKLNPWMKPVYDNVEFLMDLSREQGSKGKGRDKGYQDLIDSGLLEIEPLTYIRGRSIPHQFLVIDEAQNLTPHEIKTIITRAGEGTKVVLTGDPYQIDNPYVDSTSNGLSFVVEKFKGEALAGHMTLFKGERSPLAEKAAELL